MFSESVCCVFWGFMICSEFVHISIVSRCVSVIASAMYLFNLFCVVTEHVMGKWFTSFGFWCAVFRSICIAFSSSWVGAMVGIPLVS